MSPTSRADHIVAVVFVDVAILLMVSSLASRLARRCGQPAVIGEIVAGLVLGPSLLGLLPGDLTTWLIPLSARPYLNVLAQLGLVLFMFVVGYELEPGHLHGSKRLAAAVTTASISVPFGLGVAAAVLVYPFHHTAGGRPVGMVPLCLFVGTALSVTAFPVLARMLAERRIQTSQLGLLALACAAIGDVVAWCMLTVVVTVAASSGPWGVVRMLGEAAAFVVVLVTVMGPGTRWFLARTRRAGAAGTARGRTTRTKDSGVLALVVIGLLLCSWATAEIGLHPVFGAFAFGAALPRRDLDPLAPDLVGTVNRMSAVLLPIFFVVTGLSVDLAHIGLNGLWELALIVCVACLGKIAGAGGAARLCGVDARQSAALGVLMNTRGLTEMVILNIGLEMKVLDGPLFSALVLMAVVTTVMTGPLINRLVPATAETATTAKRETRALDSQVSPVIPRGRVAAATATWSR